MQDSKPTSDSDVDSGTSLSSFSFTPVLSTVSCHGRCNGTGSCWRLPGRSTNCNDPHEPPQHSPLSWVTKPFAVKRDRLMLKVLLSVWDYMWKNCNTGREWDLLIIYQHICFNSNIQIENKAIFIKEMFEKIIFVNDILNTVGVLMSFSWSRCVERWLECKRIMHFSQPPHRDRKGNAKETNGFQTLYEKI